jgi:hypothetical protein
MTQEQTDWHHRFGLLLKDFFTGTPCEVELERDLSVKSQFLDVLIIHKTAEILDRALPDGLEGHLVEHNLITFKSHREPLDAWALDELLGHYVNSRKQVSPNFDDLLPEDRFRLFAVCARFPEGLAGRVRLTEVQEGVYEVDWGVTAIRIVVAGRLPEREPNALLHLFSASVPLLEYGRNHCRIQSPQTSTLLLDLFGDYEVEGLTMPITMEEFIRQAERRAVLRAPVEIRLEGIPAEQRLEGIPAEQRLEGISPEQILESLAPEEREKLRKLLDDPAPS